ncbi:hypothetical protein AB6A40_004274 [Gnathostoma spinigerum]|uniref:Uncharacterized protein n=1 Tax=Gnathostoma spinigerum TaxID=75299 RepID=A0ABD6EMQ5_9BILA
MVPETVKNKEDAAHNIIYCHHLYPFVFHSVSVEPSFQPVTPVTCAKKNVILLEQERRFSVHSKSTMGAIQCSQKNARNNSKGKKSGDWYIDLSFFRQHNTGRMIRIMTEQHFLKLSNRSFSELFCNTSV